MGSLADLANMANVSLYGFEDYHGVDIGVVRAVRLWYTPIAGEIALEIKLLQGDTRLGFAISRTEEVKYHYWFITFSLHSINISYGYINIIVILISWTLSHRSRSDGTE